MRKIQLKLITLFTLIAATAVAASAQVMPYRVADRDVRMVINRIETESNTFRTDAQRDIDRNIWTSSNREESMSNLLDNFETAADQLRTNFTGRRSSASDVQMVLNRAMAVDRLMRNNTFTQRVQSEWAAIRTDLDTLAGYYSVSSNWNNTGVVVTPTAGGGWATNRYTANDRQMRTLVNQLRYRSSAFRTSFNRWSGRRGFWSNGTADTNVIQAVADLDTALNAYSSSYSNTTARDLDTILRSAATIDAFVRSSNNLNYDVSSKWGLIRSNINTLTGYYGMTNWDWRAPMWDNTATGYPTDRGGYGNGYGNGNRRGFDAMITGTYRLNTSRSDNVGDVIDRNLGTGYDANGRQTQHQWLERRLASPEMIVVEKNGNQLQIASSNAQRVDLNVDGTRQTETLPNGRTMTTSVSVTGRELTVNYEGDRSNDFYVSFTPAGRGLQVSRRIYLQNSNKTVTVNSFYDKTDDTARWDAITYTNNNTAGNYGNNNNNGYYGNYPNDVWGISNSTQIIATLDTPLSTRTIRDGDQFQMTVSSPGQYAGAIIRGTAYGNRSGSVSGRANMSFNFDSITLRNGQTYRFAGIVDGVRTLNGDTVSVNNEGQVQDRSQSNQTVTRAGVGAALGAIIGAIAGGGSGAAIGAAVGAGAGAGSIVLQGRDNLELGTGTEFRITATAPNRVGAP
ncbi:MAG: hypothetical protein ACJ73D_13675 [Pyrinomonadaceae bacterium]